MKWSILFLSCALGTLSQAKVAIYLLNVETGSAVHIGINPFLMPIYPATMASQQWVPTCRFKPVENGTLEVKEGSSGLKGAEIVTKPSNTSGLLSKMFTYTADMKLVTDGFNLIAQGDAAGSRIALWPLNESTGKKNQTWEIWP